MEQMEMVRALSALAHPIRLQVFRALVVVGEAGLTPSTIAEALGIAGATLSFHLKELMNAGLVVQNRYGRNLLYTPAYARMNGVIEYLTAHCCHTGEGARSQAASCN